MMLVALPCAAILLMLKKDFGKENDAPAREYTPQQELTRAALIGLGLGCYDGLIGPGTGTFMIMAFTMALSMDLLTASGCAKIANLCSNVASAVLFIFSGKVWWLLALPAAACNMLGAYCGARYAMRGGSKRVRGMIFVVLGLLFIKMGYELLF
jgi:putative membrane protein